MLRSPPIAKAMNQSRSETDLIKLCEDEQSHDLSSPHITQRAKKRAFSPCAKKLGKSVEEIDYRTELRDMMNQFIASQNARLETLEAHILELKQHCTKIETSNNGMASSLNGLSDQITSLESKITGLDRQRAEMCSHLSALDEKIDTLERNMIKTCVEIRNVPLRQTETKQDLYGSVAVLSNCLGIDTKSDIRDISRYRIDKKSNSSALILEFSNTLIKSKFLDSVKSYNKKNPNQKLDSTNLGFTTKVNPIFVAEQLTAQSRKLFYLARNFTRDHKYDYCWISNGRILMKKSRESPYIVIRSEAQLRQMSELPVA
ncbi:hypothetical protein PYW07_011501 [Mythimna separata]|uniref:FP protein C-terminal domain-containing protein n=1 Tax=Mythimna separata TaxID=271217 RepID=A0AAD7Y9Z3_MYTSE|nr:hypothetical protein PYW07_011501 [Mythimna separata]